MSRAVFTIGTKVTLIATACASVSLVFTILFFLIHEWNILKKVDSWQLALQANVLSKKLQTSIDNGNSDVLREQLKTASLEYNFISAVIIKENVVLEKFNFPEIASGEKLSEAGIGSIFENRKYGFPWMSKRIDINLSGADASLIVVCSEARLSKQFLLIHTYAIVILIIVATFAAACSALVKRFISRPMNNLCELAHRIRTSSDYSLRAEIKSSDELGELALGFNLMLEQIQHRDSVLEKQVQQRTLQLKKLAEEFQYQALHDALTGLPNRALFDEEVHRFIAYATRTRTNFALMLLDLDDFKTFNDEHGHDFGDEVLKAVSQTLLKSLRAVDRVFRMGGDEFVVLLSDLSHPEIAEIVCKNLMRSFQEPITISGRRKDIRISVGLAVYPIHGFEVCALYRHADLAMYRSKRNGKNSVALYSAEMGA